MRQPSSSHSFARANSLSTLHRPLNSSTSLRDPLFRMGVDYAGGIRIDDPDKAMQILSEGGGTPQLKGAGEFITYRAR